MIRVCINETERKLNEIETNWIHNTIREIQNIGLPICVKILINQGDVNVILSVGDCQSLQGSGEAPNSHEQDIFSLWDRMHVAELPINSGKIVAFLEQVKRI